MNAFLEQKNRYRKFHLKKMMVWIQFLKNDIAGSLRPPSACRNLLEFESIITISVVTFLVFLKATNNFNDTFFLSVRFYVSIYSDT